MLNRVNIYDKLKPKDKRQWRITEYMNMLTNTAISMYTYTKDDTYEHIMDDTIEKCLLTGAIGWAKDKNGKVVCGISEPYSGLLDINGYGTTVILQCLNGRSYKGLNGVDAVQAYNNSTASPDMSIPRYAEQFAEVDLSMLNNIRYTRIRPFFTAKNSKIKKAIEACLKVLDGSSNVADVILDDDIKVGNGESISTVSFTDVQSIDKLQYLSTYKNELFRTWYTIHGQALTDGMKVAQQSVEEINGNVSRSFIDPFDGLKHRQQMCEDLMRVFGGNISVDFSPCWKVEVENWLNSNKEVETDDNIE